jgi:HEAT repeat protein
VTTAAALRASDLATRLAAIAALAKTDAPAPDELAALAEALGDGRKAVERGAAETFATLARRGVAVERILDEALVSSAPRRRWGAAFALSLLGDPPLRTLPVLLDALGVDDGDVRWAAAGVVVRMTDREATARTLLDLVRAGNGRQRKMALYCLRDLGVRSVDAEHAVLRALADADWDVRLASITTLPRLALDRRAAAERLVVVLETGEARDRRAAAAALGALGERSPRVLAALRACGPDDPALRRAAERALGQLA